MDAKNILKSLARAASMAVDISPLRTYCNKLPNSHAAGGSIAIYSLAITCTFAITCPYSRWQ